MHRVAAKRTIEIFVCFQQRDFQPTPCQAQGKHHPARPPTDNAASRFAGWVEVVGLQHFFGNRSSRHGRASETEQEWAQYTPGKRSFLFTSAKSRLLWVGLHKVR